MAIHDKSGCALFAFPSFADFVEWEVQDVAVGRVFNFLKSPKTASHETFSFSNVVWIEVGFGKFAFHRDRLEIVGNDELGQYRVASNVAFGCDVKEFRIQHPDDVTQVKIRDEDILDVLAADRADITFVALRHIWLELDLNLAGVRFGWVVMFRSH